MKLTTAIEDGLVVVIDKRLTAGSGKYVVWHDPIRALPWRLALRVWPDDGKAGQSHRGFGSLHALLWWVACTELVE